MKKMRSKKMSAAFKAFGLALACLTAALSVQAAEEIPADRFKEEALDRLAELPLVCSLYYSSHRDGLTGGLQVSETESYLSVHLELIGGGVPESVNYDFERRTLIPSNMYGPRYTLIEDENVIEYGHYDALGARASVSFHKPDLEHGTIFFHNKYKSSASCQF